MRRGLLIPRPPQGKWCCRKNILSTFLEALSRARKGWWSGPEEEQMADIMSMHGIFLR
jgi:hypothetical protein